jgi:hypothetical protein
MTSLKSRRFGIELELSRKFLCVNHSERNYSKHWTWLENALYNLYEQEKIQRGWKLKVDTSCGGEVVSPILHGQDGMRQVAVICSVIQEYAYTQDISPIDGECGLHIHFDSTDMFPRQLSNLFVLLHKAEPIIYSMYPNRNPKYCAPIEINMRMAHRFRDWTDVRDLWYRGENNVRDRKHTYRRSFINGANAGDNYDGTRYHGFNIHCYWRQGTVEFRYGTGTLDPLHIKAYYEMCLSMVNTAMSKTKIETTSTTMDMNYQSLMTHVSSNYRFRKVIKKLCSECKFSRGTIKLIMDLIKKNKPYLLHKPVDDGSVNLIGPGVAANFIFRTPDDAIYMSNGLNVPKNKAKKLLQNLTVVDCDYNWSTGNNGRVQLLCISPMYKLGFALLVRPIPPNIHGVIGDGVNLAGEFAAAAGPAVINFDTLDNTTEETF